MSSGGAAAGRPRGAPAWARALAIWAARLRRRLGIRRGVSVEGVYYKELAAESLARALSKRGRGFKDYRVTFPDGSKQVIRCARDRVFADLMGPLGLEKLDAILPVVRPGARVLEFNAGTGYRANWLSYVVGPSGGVVAISVNKEHVRFAEARYPRANVSYEFAENFALAGETEGAFDGVVMLEAPVTNVEAGALVRELWRLTAPGGVMLIGVGARKDAPLVGLLRTLARTDGADVSVEGDGQRGYEVLLRKPREEGDEGQHP